LKRLAVRLNLLPDPDNDSSNYTDRVRFAGFTKDIQEVWKQNHVLVMPSRFEGLPLAIVEAMLCGRPVVATDVAGHSEIIEDGTTGFLASAPTIAAVREALERAWQSRSELHRMGQLARVRVRRLVPRDPISIFAQRLLDIAQSREEHRKVALKNTGPQ
jgi:glycosyltransferase involved in cell wall biosynthesis